MEAASIPAGTTARRRSRGLSERRLAFFMVSPSIIVMLLVAAWPIAYAIWLSLHDYSVIHPGLSRWAGSTGLRNYSDVLWGDYSGDFWSAVRVTVVFTAFSVAFEFVLGLAMALAMHSAFKGQGVLRTVVLVPWAVLTVVTAIMWKTIFDSNLGFVNSVLGTHTVWLGEQPQALIVLIVADVWKTAPFMALLLLAGLQVIPGDIYEAAKVDGATMWQRFTKITLPLLRPAIVVALIFRTLDALRIFDLPFVLTQGSHGTTTLSILAQETFQTNNIQGRGSALSVLTFVIVMLVSFLYIRLVGGNIRGLEEA
jgi:multiple sugar transport system permease protein